MICHECHVWWRVPEKTEYEFEEAEQVVKCKDLLSHMEEWETWKLFQTIPGQELELVKP